MAGGLYSTAGGRPRVFLYLDLDGNFAAQIEALAFRISPQSLQEFLAMVADPYMRQRTANRFASEGDDASGAWQALSPATVAIRESQGYPGEHPINFRSGELEAFLVQNPSSVYREEDGALMEYPGSQPSGRLMDKFAGAQRGKGRAPARPVLAVNKEDTIAVMTSLHDYITSGGGVGGGEM